MMMRFSYYYVRDLTQDPEQAQLVAGEHAAYWRGLDLPNYLGGPLADGSTGHITFEADSLEEAQRLLQNDPFMRKEVLAHAWLNEWHVE